jgi:N,N'-diacetylchitobiose non-reducing end deacetylase
MSKIRYNDTIQILNINKKGDINMNILETALGIPNVENYKRILCVQPHPDDNEVGAGATIAKLAENGCEIYFLTVTDGCLGTSNLSISVKDLVETRKKEMQNAADFLKVKNLFSLGYRDNITIGESELAHKIVEIIREIKPQAIMTVDPWLPYESHPDHRKVGMAAAEAAIFASNPRYPYIDESTAYNTCNIEAIAFYNTAFPNSFVDITGYMDKKLAAIAMHKSQFSGETLQLFGAYFTEKAKQLATDKDFEMAEGFKVLTPLHLHCFVDAIHI